MSKRAEEAALEAYPYNRAITSNDVEYDGNFCNRLPYTEGYDQAESDTIERACEWLFAHLPILVDYYNEDIHENADRSDFIKLFRKQMEEE